MRLEVCSDEGCCCCCFDDTVFFFFLTDFVFRFILAADPFVVVSVCLLPDFAFVIRFALVVVTDSPDEDSSSVCACSSCSRLEGREPSSCCDDHPRGNRVLDERVQQEVEEA